MSRLGKKPIVIPSGTEVKVAGLVLSVKGPLGALSRNMPESIEVKINGNAATVNPKSAGEGTKAIWGTWVSHLKNMIAGVNKAFEKRLLIEGVGYKCDIKGNEAVFNVGYSHQVFMKIPEGIKVVSDKNGILVSGIDKEKVGDFAARMRAVKKPEPYKGKGLRYADEVIRRKQGKKTV